MIASENTDASAAGAAHPLAVLLGLFLFCFAFDRFVDFFTVHRDVTWSVDSKSDFVSADLDNHQGDVVANDDFFVFFSAEHKHLKSPVNLSS
jgi:hypothetical protein